MYFNDGNQYRPVTDPALHMRNRELFQFIASYGNGVVDTYFDYNRRKFSAMLALVMHQYVMSTKKPEEQANAFCDLIGNLDTNEMVMLDIEDTSIADPVDFAQRWLSIVETRLSTLAWVYVTRGMSGKLTRKVTGNRIVKASYLSSPDTPVRNTIPDWSWDVHQYSLLGNFPGCAQTGNINYTAFTVPQLLARCHGTASTIRTARRPRALPLGGPA